jgi:hypothetical protein
MDLQRSDDYEAALATLLRLHPHGRVVADRDLFEDLGHWKKTWRKTYDGAAELHVLCREDGTVGLGVYRQWRRLALKKGVPCVLHMEGFVEDSSPLGSFELRPFREAPDADVRRFAEAVVVAPRPGAPGRDRR